MAKRHLHMTQDPTGKTANGFLEKSLPNIIVKEKEKVLLLSTFLHQMEALHREK